MDFNALKIIWDEQKAEKFYAYDESAFAQLIETKCLAAKSRANLQDWTLIGIFLCTTAFIITKSLLHGESFQNMYAAIFSLGAAAYVFARRQLKRKTERRFDQSLSGILSQAVFHQQSIVRLGTTMMLWLGIPYLALAVANFFFIDTESPAWLFPVMLLPLPLMYIVVRIGLSKTELPKLKELESLQRKYTEQAP